MGLASIDSRSADSTADAVVQPLVDRIRVFGFHLATLDVREDARRHARVIGEILTAGGVVPADGEGTWDSLDEEAQERLLLDELRPLEEDEERLELLDELRPLEDEEPREEELREEEERPFPPPPRLACRACGDGVMSGRACASSRCSDHRLASRIGCIGMGSPFGCSDGRGRSLFNLIWSFRACGDGRPQ